MSVSFQMLGGADDVERPVEPHGALGQHHAIGEHRAAIEDAVAVRVLEAQDAVRLLGELLLDLGVRARRLGDVEAALLVEVGDDRPLDERRPGDAHDLEAVGHRERRLSRLLRRGPAGKGADAEGNACQRAGRATHRAVHARLQWMRH